MSFEKYTTALAMMDQVAAVSEVASISDNPKDYSKLFTEKWDALYEYIFANFKDPETHSGNDLLVNSTPEQKLELLKDHTEIHSMVEMFKLGREELESRLHDIPPTILEECFPVWIARYLLRYRGCQIIVVSSTTFRKFNKNYHNMVYVAAGFPRK